MKVPRFLMILVVIISQGACAQSSATPQPTATATPVPPTEPPPTDTPLPPTATATPIPPTEPPPTDTPLPPTDTPTREPTRTPITFQVHYDIQYGATQNQLLDVYQPQMEQALPTVILLSGTGYLKMYMVDTAEFFVRRGYAVVAFNKGLGQYPRYEQDSFCALAWVHANAEAYNLDPERIALVGFSLGGALAAFLGTVDDAGKYMEGCPHALPEADYVSGVATVAGFFDYALWIPGASEDGLIYTYFGPPAQNMEAIREASPVNWVDGSEPPFLLVHGENDTAVDPNQSVEFEALLSQAGVDVELVLLPQLIHDNITTSSKALLRINEFLTNLFESD